MLSFFFVGISLLLGLQVQKALAFIECSVLDYGKFQG